MKPPATKNTTHLTLQPQVSGFDFFFVGGLIFLYITQKTSCGKELKWIPACSIKSMKKKRRLTDTVT